MGQKPHTEEQDEVMQRSRSVHSLMNIISFKELINELAGDCQGGASLSTIFHLSIAASKEAQTDCPAASVSKHLGGTHH
jgi:hypothetical protein